MTTNPDVRTILLAALIIGLLSGTASGQDPSPAPAGVRWDVSLDLPVWPSLSDLQPDAGGSFDTTGFGLGGSFHFPVIRNTNSDVLFGFDGLIGATDSNIPGVYDDFLARQLYLGTSVKWLFGEARNVSLDAGIGYHEVDMAEVNSSWWGNFEYEHWSTSEASTFIGATWDVGASRPNKNGGLFIGLRIHFVDFGRVYDEGPVFLEQTLGPDAGRLDGPLYLFRIGFSGR